MKSSTPRPQTHHQAILKISTLVAGALILGVILYTAMYNYWYQGRIYPGVFIGPVAVGGMTPVQAEETVETLLDAFKQKGLTYTYHDEVINIKPSIISSLDAGFLYELINWNTQDIGALAYSTGRRGTWLTTFFTPLFTRFSSPTIPLTNSIDTTKLETTIRESIAKYEQPAIDAQITWTVPTISVTPSVSGSTFDYPVIMEATKQRIASLSIEPIQLAQITDLPNVRETEIPNTILSTIEQLRDNKPVLVFTNNNLDFSYPFAAYQDAIILTTSNTQNITYTLSTEWLTTTLSSIKTTIDTPAQNARFSIKDGKVTEFLASKDGIILPIDTAISHIQQAFTDQQYTITLPLEVVRATVQNHDVNNLGITEIIGIGISDFSGSPANRRKNIAVGAEALNGLLIKPGEEFSLLKNLVPIDATQGYLPELVIKGNQTIPEYGGGLCQIGTTAFRAALASGLDITQRQNHSYRVSYYEPAGTDATIYDPAPDFRWLNDTPHHVLIQTRMTEDSKLIFEYWGTDDGRNATTTTPRIYNITAPPPTKYIDTDTLEPGQIRCTESAHNGADADFTYTIEYPDGTTHQEVFKSHYRPWQEVCLRGIDPAEQTTSSSQPIIE